MRTRKSIAAENEKLSARRTDEYFRERAARADVKWAKRMLKLAGKNRAPVPGDEVR